MKAVVRSHPVTAGLVLVLVVSLAVWTVRMVQVQQGVKRARQYWAQPRGEPGGLLYVALGDSTAQGVGASRPERGYVGLLAERLRTTTGRPVQVVNLSRSGARIADVLSEQLPRLRELRPSLVTVAIGGNDVRAYDATTFAAQVESLTAALPAGTVVADAPYFMHGHWERHAQQAADTLTRSAHARGLDVVPLHEALRREGWSAMFDQFAADWFHPNDRGYRVWERVFWDTIRTSPAGARLHLSDPVQPTPSPRTR